MFWGAQHRALHIHDERGSRALIDELEVESFAALEGILLQVQAAIFIYTNVEPWAVGQHEADKATRKVIEESVLLRNAKLERSSSAEHVGAVIATKRHITCTELGNLATTVVSAVSSELQYPEK